MMQRRVIILAIAGSGKTFWITDFNVDRYDEVNQFIFSTFFLKRP